MYFRLDLGSKKIINFKILQVPDEII